MSEPEIKALLKEMDQAPYVASCPHGRPSIWKFPLRELEKNSRDNLHRKGAKDAKIFWF